jgi:hypothetical protein
LDENKTGSRFAPANEGRDAKIEFPNNLTTFNHWKYGELEEGKEVFQAERSPSVPSNELVARSSKLARAFAGLEKFCVAIFRYLAIAAVEAKCG